MSRTCNKLKEYTTKAGFAVLSAAMVGTKALAATTEISDTEGITLLTGTPGEIIDRIISVVLWVVGILAVVYLIWGGIIYVTAGGDAEKAGKGRTAITNAIIGIIIVSLALIIYKAVVGGLTGGVGGFKNNG